MSEYNATNIVSSLEFLYGERAQATMQQLESILKQEKFFPKLSSEKSFWYKSINLYCIYPDGIIYDSQQTPLQNLSSHLPIIKKLGCNAIHLLPFLESPMVDRGFDISDFLAVRKNLGTESDLNNLLSEAKNLDIKLFMDLVFNHVSDQHIWFQKAQAGDPYYRDFFITVKDKPHFIRKFYKESAVWAEYDVEGEKKIVNIAFPEYAGSIPHWRQGTDGYWYYHTYYPQQLDLNWRNPNVFLELVKVIIYWTKKDFNFRFDAIPFIGKSAYKEISEDNSAAHAITTAFKNIVEQIAPNCAFLIETYEKLPKVVEYFGDPHNMQVNLSYNFHLCTSAWVSLVTENTSYLWNKIDQLYVKPEHAEWLNFLRNHDELSLAFLSDELLIELQTVLGKHGANFREGCGISGRTFSLLANSYPRFLMAYFLLASLPGSIMIPYGDEIAAPNIPLEQLSETEKHDTRNINRGVLAIEQYQLAISQDVFEQISYILQQRKQYHDFLEHWPVHLTALTTAVFAAYYRHHNKRLFVYINVSNQQQTIHVNFASLQLAAHINEIQLTANKLMLMPYAGAWFVE